MRDDAKKGPFQVAPEQTLWTLRGFWFVFAGSEMIVLAPVCPGLLMENHFVLMAWWIHRHL